MSYLLEKYTNEHSRFMVIKGELLHYRIEGKGEPILLIHGAFSSLHTYDAWTKILKKDYQVIRLDLPGFGLSDGNIDQDHGMQNYIECLHEFLNKIKIKNCHIAGSSLGGWLSWEYAAQYPKRINRLILIDAAGYLDNSNVPLPFKMARTPFLGKVVKYAIHRNILQQFVKQVYVDESKVTTELIDRYYELFSRAGNPEAFLVLVNGKVRSRTYRLKRLPHETLILWGKEDSWLPVNNAYRFRSDIPNSRLIVYDDVGHLPMEEIPEMSVMDIQAFLTSDVKVVNN